MSTFESYNELDLWKLFLEGDKEAFSVFYRHNYRKLYSYGISLGMDSELIDDIIQELFVKLYTRPQLIKDFSTIQAFLYAALLIMKNKGKSICIWMNLKTLNYLILLKTPKLNMKKN
jgi:hypothetical protein